MHIHSLKVANFRLFKDKSLHLEPGLNLIWGLNAAGKTTLLEALYILIAGRSFRSPHFHGLAQENTSFFQIECSFEKSSIPQSMKMQYSGKEKKIQYNSTDLNSFSALLGILQGVLLAPHDIDLIKGVPQVRRHYLDLQLAQIDPLYVHHLLRYSKGLKQRNWMLRNNQLAAVEAYEMQIAQAASYLLNQRKKLIAWLEKEVQSLYQAISDRAEPLHLGYHSTLGEDFTQQAIALMLRKIRLKDFELGATTCGPHRDELKINLNGKEAKHFASEGEMRSLAAAMKLAEWRHMQKAACENPILMVDDLGISLDKCRLENLIRLFSDLGGQVVITCAHQISSISRINSIELE